ncbi:unnamed protein product [Caenorhabditis sp. 36 PRJEB53466]|nr:unnamed protein product [Caenorhabditis sp. 36 PRJEB53466]
MERRGESPSDSVSINGGEITNSDNIISSIQKINIDTKDMPDSPRRRQASLSLARSRKRQSRLPSGDRSDKNEPVNQDKRPRVSRSNTRSRSRVTNRARSGTASRASPRRATRAVNRPSANNGPRRGTTPIDPSSAEHRHTRSQDEFLAPPSKSAGKRREVARKKTEESARNEKAKKKQGAKKNSSQKEKKVPGKDEAEKKKRKETIRSTIATNRDVVSEDESDGAAGNRDEPDDGSNYLIMVLVKKEDCRESITTDFGDRIRVLGPKYVALIPKSCNEGRRAQKFGSFKICDERPGIPNRKFSAADRSKYGDKAEWPVQAVYEVWEDGKIDTKNVFVHYEGWAPITKTMCTIASCRDTASEMLQEAEWRRMFFEAYKANAKRIALIDAFRDTLSGKWKPRPDIEEQLSKRDPCKQSSSSFWSFEDMTYYHSVANKEVGLAPVFYMNLSQQQKKTPYYAYTPVNIVDSDALKECEQHDAIETWSALTHALNVARVNNGSKSNVCENSAECKCDVLAQLVYGSELKTHQQLSYYYDDVTQQVLLNLEDFDPVKKRIVVECSDACKCSLACPRRRLQKGQQKPLFVVHQGDSIGFHLYAGSNIEAGELICEYTGEMQLIPQDEWDEEAVALHAKQLAKKAESENPTTQPVAKPVPIRRPRGRPSKNSVRPAPVPEKKEKTLEPGGPQEETEKEEADCSYDVLCGFMNPKLRIRAYNKGNIARFANHSCAPNAVFVEVHSRRFEKDPLIPRVAIYAKARIALGQEITISYWLKHEMGRRRNWIACRCGSDDCMRYLPSGD